MSALFTRFIALWTLPDHAPVPVDPEALDGAEIRLGLLVPDAYRRSLVAHGAPSTSAALLARIVDQDVDMADVQDFFSPADIVQVTEEWRALGLPATAVESGSSPSRRGRMVIFSGLMAIQAGPASPAWPTAAVTPRSLLAKVPSDRSSPSNRFTWPMKSATKRLAGRS